MTQHKPHIRPHRPVVSTVPAGCLVIMGGVVLVAVAAIIAMLGILAPGYRDTPTYREAMALVQGNAVAREALVLLAWTEVGNAPSLIVGVECKFQTDRVFYPAQEAHAGVGLFLHGCLSRFLVMQCQFNGTSESPTL